MNIKWHTFWWTPEFLSVELFKVQKYPNTRKVLKNFKVTAKPKVLENLKRAWELSWKVMEFKELKRVGTLCRWPWLQ